MFDGAKSVSQVLTASSGLGVTQADIDHMVSSGFLRENAPSAAPVAAAASVTAAAPAPVVAAVAPAGGQASSSVRTPQERFASAWPLATQLTASLGLRGFRLNLSVEGASGYDDLLALFPKIQAAVGAEKATALERALKD